MKIKLDLSNILKNFINKDNQYTIPIFIPHKGCPNNCIFCNQKRISGQLKNVSIEEIDNIINEYLGYYDVHDKRIEIAFFGGSFTGIDITLQRQYLGVAKKYVDSRKVDSIRLSTRPDYIDEDILTMLKEYNVGTIELGVQSMDEKVLNYAKRGHTASDVIFASKLIKKYGIKLGHQIMIGLPNSTLETELYTIRECLKLGPTQLRIYPVYVIEDSELYDMYKPKKVVIVSAWRNEWNKLVDWMKMYGVKIPAQDLEYFVQKDTDRGLSIIEDLKNRGLPKNYKVIDDGTEPSYICFKNHLIKCNMMVGLTKEDIKEKEKEMVKKYGN